jgi:hypothetical protein
LRRHQRDRMLLYRRREQLSAAQDLPNGTTRAESN